MKRIIVLLIAAAVILLTACAKNVEATPDTGTADVTAAQEATPTDPPTEAPTDAPTPEELAQERYDAILTSDTRADRSELKVQELYQYPELPSGCEAVSLTIAINHFGYALGKTEIAESYLEYGDNFVTAFAGNPFRYGGSGIYPPGLIKTVENFCADTDATLCAFDTTDLTIDELYRFIDAGCPVVVWTTVYMNWPYFNGGDEYQGKFYPWYDLEHCVCMYGYDKNDGTVMIADPQRGKISVSAEQFEKIYDEIGRFSMILMDTSEWQ